MLAYPTISVPGNLWWGSCKAVCGLAIKAISRTSKKINLALSLVAAAPQIWCCHLRNVLSSGEYILKIRGEGKEEGDDPKKSSRCWKVSFMRWIAGRPVINLIKEKRSKSNVITVCKYLFMENIFVRRGLLIFYKSTWHDPVDKYRR